jgi:hypothetical protein
MMFLDVLQLHIRNNYVSRDYILGYNFIDRRIKFTNKIHSRFHTCPKEFTYYTILR